MRKKSILQKILILPNYFHIIPLLYEQANAITVKKSQSSFGTLSKEPSWNNTFQ